MKELDVRHLACPGPVLAVRDALNEGAERLRVLVADNLALSNVTRFATSRGATVESSARGVGDFVLEITAGEESASPVAGEEAILACDVPSAAGPTVLQITAGTMGRGDDDLGSLLLRAFLKTQIELEAKPKAAVFYNNGVKLCCRGSLLIDDLRALEAEGVEIIACGTCLNYFDLADQLEVGRVTDMLEIASILAGSGRLIRP